MTESSWCHPCVASPPFPGIVARDTCTEILWREQALYIQKICGKSRTAQMLSPPATESSNQFVLDRSQLTMPQLNFPALNSPLKIHKSPCDLKSGRVGSSHWIMDSSYILRLKFTEYSQDPFEKIRAAQRGLLKSPRVATQQQSIPLFTKRILTRNTLFLLRASVPMFLLHRRHLSRLVVLPFLFIDVPDMADSDQRRNSWDGYPPLAILSKTRRTMQPQLNRRLHTIYWLLLRSWKDNGVVQALFSCATQRSSCPLCSWHKNPQGSGNGLINIHISSRISWTQDSSRYCPWVGYFC